MWVVLGSVFYVSQEAKGCYSLEKYGIQNNSHTAMWVVLVSVFYFSQESKGCSFLKKVQNLKQLTLCDVGCFGLRALSVKGC